MSVDPNRQWFVYHKETELGPFSEQELVSKIRQAEFDESTFLYTDGMSDWELIKDTSIAELVKDKQVEEVSGDAPFEEKSDTQKVDLLAGTAEDIAEDPSVTKKPKKSFNLRPVFYLLFLLVLVAAYLMNRDLINEYISRAVDSDGSFVDMTKEGQQVAPIEEVDKSAIEWSQLDTFVRIKDPKGVTFKLASKPLAGMRPLIVGALSPILPMNKLTIAVFPDNETSLYAIPPVWMWSVDVSSGYFSAGPHLYKGGDLLAGKYIVMIAAENKFLGEASFSVGDVQSGKALESLKKGQIDSLKKLSNQEKTSILSTFKKVEALQKRIDLAAKLAIAQKAKRRAWLEQRTGLLEDLTKVIKEQREVLSGPMFFAPEQSVILKSLEAMDKYMETLEFYSYGGERHVKAKGAESVKSQKTKIDDQFKIMASMIGELETKEVNEPLALDKNIIKTQLLEDSK